MRNREYTVMCYIEMRVVDTLRSDLPACPSVRKKIRGDVRYQNSLPSYSIVEAIEDVIVAKT